MSIRSIVTRGFVFGPISKLVTIGYDIGEDLGPWTNKDTVVTNWNNQSAVSTTWNNQASAGTIWTDKT